MKFSALYTVFSMPDEIPAGASGEASADATAPMTGAPGCETPAPERVIFPALAAAGGKFRSIPYDANGSVDFDVNLVPDLPAFPRSKDAEGKDIPFPWEGHNRGAYFALKADCFDSKLGYFQYRAFEAIEKARICLSEYNDIKSGVKAAATTKQDKTEKALLDLATRTENASPEEQAAVALVLEMLKKKMSKPIGE